jgi:beta-glucosidase
MVRVAVAASLWSVCVAETHSTKANPEDFIVDVFGKHDGFLWGSATAAAQVEGAWNVSDKQPSIWDDHCHNIPHRDTTLASTDCSGNTTEVADDFYHRFREDVDMVAQHGMNAMRVSISWSRVFPLKDGVHVPSASGIGFYNDLFDYMLSKKVTPLVTLYHWDLPNDLSWLEPEVVEEFVAFANVSFASFSQIKHWATLNEPNSFCMQGYNTGRQAPGHVSKKDHLLCGHHALQSHALAVKLFREQYQQPDSEIGIILDFKWPYPRSDSIEDHIAAHNHIQFGLAYWADPIFFGDYPQEVKDYYGDVLPKFTDVEMAGLKGTADFLGVNSYGGEIAKWDPRTYAEKKDGDDMGENLWATSPCRDMALKADLVDPDWECNAESAVSNGQWFWAKPDAMNKLLVHLHHTYKPRKIYITEFGTDVLNETKVDLTSAIHDSYRQQYYQSYIVEIAKAAIDSGVPVAGIFAWSLLDNLEWGGGLNHRFGITYVDYETQTRYPKESFTWFSKLISRMDSANRPSQALVV